jgi:hypothetical protein
VQTIEALGIRRKKFPILCHTLPPSTSIDGLLGLDFFKDVILTIDFKKNEITISATPQQVLEALQG